MEETSKASHEKSKNSRKMIIVAVLVVILFLGLGGYMVMRKSMMPPSASPQAMKVSPTASSGMFGSIQDALSKSLSLQCEYSENGMKTTAYIKAGSVRADILGGTAEQNGSVIVKDEKMYFWNGKQGMMMSLSAITAVPAASGAAKPTQTPNKNIMESLEKYKDACKIATVSDAHFTPPADVKFVDQTKMMESMQQMQKTATPGQPINDAQMKMIQEQMKQYQQSTGN